MRAILVCCLLAAATAIVTAPPARVGRPGFLSLLLALPACAAAATLSLEAGHPANRLRDLEVVGLADGVLTLKAQAPAEGMVVLKATQPTRILSVTGGEAHLRPGWDGTLGYSLYGLQVKAPGAGTLVVRLGQEAPPREPVPTTAAEAAAFERELAARPSRPTEPFRDWQAAYRKHLAAWLMNGGLPARVPLNARVTETTDHPRFTLRRIEYRSRVDRGGTALLSLPKGVAGAPLLLALHGHEAPWGQADPKAFSPGHNDDFCATFAERGWAVLQPATMDHQLQHPGWTLQGEWTWDAMVALDYAAALPEVDANRIAVCGLSTGAHLAMNVLALDDRVKAGVVSGILSTWNHYRRRFRIPPHCDCGIGGQLGERLEGCDWAALAAPKRVQFHHGRKDFAMCPGAHPGLLNLEWNTGVMPQAEFDTMWHEVERGYALAGAPGAVAMHFHPEGHRVDNEAALEWISR